MLLLFFFPFIEWGFNDFCGGRDARKEIGLNGARREMEDTELEEGEACFYQNNEEFDSNMDPDVALSYIVSLFLHLAFVLQLLDSRFDLGC